MSEKNKILGEFLHVSPSLFDRTVVVHQKHAEHELTFTDSMSVAHVEQHDYRSRVELRRRFRRGPPIISHHTPILLC